MSLVRLEQLFYLVEIANCKSINKAAENLHLSHQSLSKSMQHLEDELSSTLLLRTNKGITLTGDGEKTLAFALHILEEIDEFKYPFISKNKRGKQLNALTLICSPVFFFNIVPYIYSVLAKEAPDFSLDSYEKDNAEILDSLSQNPNQVALIADARDNLLSFRNAHPELFVNFIFEDTYRVGVAKNHFLAKRRSISSKDLLQYPLAIYVPRQNSRSPILDILTSYGQPNIICLTDNMNLFNYFLESGKALVITQKYLAHPNEHINYLTLKDFPSSFYAAITGKTFCDDNPEFFNNFFALLTAALHQS